MTALLGDMHDVPVGARKPLLARVRYLQRRGFPGGINAGRGGVTSYGLEQILKLALAFELIDAGLSPTHAMLVVEAEWTTPLRALALGHRVARGAAPAADGVVLVAATSALRSLPDRDADRDEDRDESPPRLPVEPFGALPARALQDWLLRPGRRDRAGYVLIDPVRLMHRLAHHLGELEANEGMLDAGMAELGTAAFGTDQTASWRFD